MIIIIIIIIIIINYQRINITCAVFYFLRVWKSEYVFGVDVL